MLVTARVQPTASARPLKNALDFLFHEWNRKPVSFVSYGGVSGGLRGVPSRPSSSVAARAPHGALERRRSPIIPARAGRQVVDGALTHDDARETAMRAVIDEPRALAPPGPLAALRG